MSKIVESLNASAELEVDELYPSGPAGPSNVLTIGEVTKGDEAHATITGESPKQILNLVLPKGEKGDIGEKGEEGTKWELVGGITTTLNGSVTIELYKDGVIFTERAYLRCFVSLGGAEWREHGTSKGYFKGSKQWSYGGSIDGIAWRCEVYKNENMKELLTSCFLSVGAKGTDGINGADGKTPIKGKDYWTEGDINEVQEYCNNLINDLADGFVNKVVMSSVEPEGENRKDIWLRQSVNVANPANFGYGEFDWRGGPATGGWASCFTHTDFIEIPVGVLQVTVVLNTVNNIKMYCYDENKSYKSQFTVSSGKVISYTFNIDSTIKYIRLVVGDYIVTDSWTRVPMVYFGNEILSYEDYVEPKLFVLRGGIYYEFLENEINSVKTYCQSLIDEKISQAIGGEY